MNTTEVFGEAVDAVYEIKISRGDKMNALTDAMYGSLVEHFLFAEANSEVKVIYLRSDNAHFSAGNDLADFLENEFNVDSNVINFLRTLAGLKKPLVCAIGGAAVGIGTTLLLHCDLVYASLDTKFSMPFIKLGLTPEGGSSLLLRQRCGTAKANDWLLTGRTFLAEEALSAGLVNGLCDDTESTWNEARNTAKQLTKKSSRVLNETKALLKSEHIDEVIRIMGKEAKVFAESLETEEAKAAFKAFLKR
ncbi:MAG: enoyl-CoA hydratase/isomerase family protein [Kangiellaceae bacterium]|nr:enoyl-CoA hydratase/isomerase family protein [Kangiellaceae bacterium]